MIAERKLCIGLYSDMESASASYETLFAHRVQLAQGLRAILNPAKQLEYFKDQLSVLLALSDA